MLVAAPENWDEACFAVPAIRALAGSGLSLGVFCPETQRAFWETVAGLKVVSFPPKASSRNAASQITGRWQASLAWETGVAVEAFYRAHIPRRLGPEGKKLQKWISHPIVVHLAPGPVKHRVQHYLSQIEALGIHTAQPEFFATADLGIRPEKQTILLSPDSDYGPAFEWPLERWVELTRRLMDDGQHLTITGIPGGRNLGQSLLSSVEENLPFFEAVPLTAALPLLAVHSLVIAADGSLPHLAAHVGSTCVTLFGPNDPAQRRPLGKRNAVARRHVECAPCFLKKCPLDLRCQNDLTLERVFGFVREKLACP